MAIDNYKIDITPFLEDLKISRADNDKLFSNHAAEYKQAFNRAVGRLGLNKFNLMMYLDGGATVDILVHQREFEQVRQCGF